MACDQNRTCWTFHADDLDSSDVRDLLALHFRSMHAISPRDSCHVLEPDSLRSPQIRFWSLRENGRLLGVGALKALAPDHGEVKSMRTAGGSAGRGVGRAMLHHIIAEARSSGHRRLSLETGTSEPFAAALHLYRSGGFVACAPFGGYTATPFTCFLTLAL